ncbi:MAG: hypothetical protein KA804_07080 [Ottowia sp.]|uniref:hypothetical protein n=1 Tax=Ottowia sp. TaxID=1898956 RepID=UPI001B7647D9|nr:hypothetical protein [Ottowia sp.]MBP7456003.1 hypothetical protein [Ottowia sp.]MBP8895895.1 hypothetical protein [Ottowia sp.]HRM54235.1 hypothetical protein [Ottowia sp.]HRN06937.1 hypothetical protein [Ottowia sp.]
MLDQFVKMTQRIIAEDGFDNYLPTLLLPATREVRVLDQVEGDGESLGITDWLAEQVGPDEDFLVAFKAGDAHFMVVGRLGGQACERLCEVGA